MSRLTIFADYAPKHIFAIYEEEKEIAQALQRVEIGFERWKTYSGSPTSLEEIGMMYQKEIAQIMQSHHFASYDILRLTPDFPEKIAIRKKFLQEHVHSEDEVRFFVEGGGLFCLHIEDKIYSVCCQAQDFISVPTGTKHWFDAGENPSFSVIRFFTNTEGWVAKYTGSDIALGYPVYATP